MDKRELSKQLAEAMRPAFTNQLNQALYRFVGDQAVVMGDSSHDYINHGYLFNPDVYSIISLISRNFANIPWVLHEVKNETQAKKYARLPYQTKLSLKGTRVLRKAFEEIESHKLLDVLDRPNPYQGGSEFFENLIGFKLITGNSYVYGIGPETGKNAGTFQELWMMPAQHVVIETGGWMQPVKGYSIENYRDSMIEAKHVLHWKTWSPDYSAPGTHLYGVSPLRAARRVVTQSNDSYTANLKALQNMGAVGILSAKSGITSDNAKELQKKWVSQHHGPHNTNKVLVTAGEYSWINMGLSPVDLNIIESQKMSLRDLCNVYGVRSEMLNDPDAKTNANNTQARKSFYHETILPEWDSIRDELNRWFVPAYSKAAGKNYYLDYDIAEVPALSEDLKELHERLKTEWRITPNEWRAAMQYDALEDELMDKIYIPGTLKPLDKSGESAPNPLMPSNGQGDDDDEEDTNNPFEPADKPAEPEPTE